MAFHPRSFPEALETLESLPWKGAQGRFAPAARAGIELALLDAAMRAFRRSVNDVVQWMGLPGFGQPGSVEKVRFSGVLWAASPRETLRRLRRMYWYGLRHFTLKVGMTEDLDRLPSVLRYLQRPLAARRATVRLDADGAWSLDSARDALTRLRGEPIAAVEQPLPVGQESHLSELRRITDVPWIHDESVRSLEDAKRLMALGVADMFKLGIGKCGGLLPALVIAGLARRQRVPIVWGGGVRETSVLAGAGLRFLEVTPGIQWAEGCFGRFLLRDDVTSPSLRFRYAGRLPGIPQEGLTVAADATALEKYAERPPILLQF
jgi:L-alanine-DL-glutamate epimerase-like enolase superfamily enzyme